MRCRHQSRRCATLGLLVAGVLTCQSGTAAPGATSSPPPTPSVSPDGVGGGSPAAANRRLGTAGTTGSSSTGEAITPEAVVDLIADKTLFPVSLEAAPRRFAPVVELRRESPAPEVVLLVGGRPGLRRIEIAYSEGGSGSKPSWVFSQATVLLSATPPDDVPGLFKRLQSALQKKLGKPRFTKRGDAPLPRIGWTVRKKVELWLLEETSTLPDATAPERHIRIDVAVPAGEAD